nr:immunoglobulin heavy chain junction region [Mus musculus]MBK4184336.1 immunoglobulin heavy chain junction region [Mus musculus]MBK4184337.1 immunoglobulin heavy chain junction region [Mus musculus]MBK4184339.1 immunoglobulin heavy chain junction region [Mus musculus]
CARDTPLTYFDYW